jgi:hypothetical protein
MPASPSDRAAVLEPRPLTESSPRRLGRGRHVEVAVARDLADASIVERAMDSVAESGRSAIVMRHHVPKNPACCRGRRPVVCRAAAGCWSPPTRKRPTTATRFHVRLTDSLLRTFGSHGCWDSLADSTSMTGPRARSWPSESSSGGSLSSAEIFPNVMTTSVVSAATATTTASLGTGTVLSYCLHNRWRNDDASMKCAGSRAT